MRQSRIQQAYKEFEKYTGLTNNPKARGKKGDVEIRQTPVDSTSMAQKFVDATISATGISEILDYNDPKTPMGPFTRWQLYQRPNGERESSSTAYLQGLVDNNGKSYGRRKLTILSKTSALRVLFDKNKKAIGVEYVKEGQFGRVFANKKVILCTGVFSPKLLMLSGVGPKKLLKERGIDVVFPNDNVGKNLVNHPLINAVFTANPNDHGVPENDPNALYVGGAFLPDPTLGSDQTKRGVQLIGMSPGAGTFMVCALLLNPKSRGYVEVQSNDPLKPVLATDELFTNPDDLESFKNIFKVYIANIAAQLAAIDPQYQLVTPSLSIINDDDLLTDFIKENVDIAHHWMGSCSMGKKGHRAVVNKYGHVIGVKDLVIADASISPFPNDGNTSAPAFMIGRVIAEQLIKAEKKK